MERNTENQHPTVKLFFRNLLDPSISKSTPHRRLPLANNNSSNIPVAPKEPTTISKNNGTFKTSSSSAFDSPKPKPK